MNILKMSILFNMFVQWTQEMAHNKCKTNNNMVIQVLNRLILVDISCLMQKYFAKFPLKICS